MGRRCGRRRFAERDDAAAGARLQCGERESAGGGQDRKTAEELLALGRNAGDQSEGLLSVYAGHESSVWATRSNEDDGGGGRPGERLPASQAPRRSNAAR